MTPPEPGTATVQAHGRYTTTSMPNPDPQPTQLAPATLRTSQPDWLAQLTRAYRSRTQVELIDDAGIGIDPATQSLLQMGVTGKLSHKEWTAVAIAGGMTLFGATMVILAIVDPDPTSKLGLLVGSGAILALTGGFQTIRVLTRQKPPNITISAKGIH
ncbi:MAG: hypothetical protein WA414_20345, partial [Acidobacteriaceae bacterium]